MGNDWIRPGDLVAIHAGTTLYDEHINRQPQAIYASDGFVAVVVQRLYPQSPEEWHWLLVVTSDGEVGYVNTLSVEKIDL